VPRSLGRAALVAAPLAAAAWAVARAVEPDGRIGTLLLVVGIVVVAGLAYVVGLRALGGTPTLHPTPPSGQPPTGSTPLEAPA
jgi:hypothetical protein